MQPARPHVPPPMKIAYLVHFRGGSESGILRKVAAQASTWSGSGIEVGLFVATASESVDAWRTLPEARRVVTPPSGPLALLRERESLALSVDAWGPDIVYTRHGLSYPGLVRLAHHRPCVIEVNGDDLAEARIKSSARYYVTRATRGPLLKRAAGLVFVTNELAAKPSFAKFGRPSIVIGNGIDLASIAETPAPTNEQPRLLFLGHPRSAWHGLDKLKILADLRPAWHVDVVGPSSAELADAPANLVAHGPLELAAYETLRAAADIGVGSLAMHRAGINEASTLKVREYLAAGLPSVIGYKDTDFMDGAEFLLQVPNEPDAIRHSLDAIDRFVEHWRGRRVPRDAVAHLDVAVKERARMGFLHGLIDA